MPKQFEHNLKIRSNFWVQFRILISENTKPRQNKVDGFLTTWLNFLSNTFTTVGDKDILSFLFIPLFIRILLKEIVSSL